MRDIHPQKRPYRPKKPKRPVPQKNAVPEAPVPEPQPKKSTRFSGSKVPVSATKVEPPFARTPVKDPEKLQPKKFKAKPKGKSKQETQVSGPKPSLKETPAPKRERAPRIGRRERSIFIVLLLLALAAGALAAIIFLPQADVELILRTAPLLVDEELKIEPGRGTDGTIPGTGFSREVQVTGTYPVQGTETIGEKATGTVQLVNRTFDEQKIKERSRLETEDGQLFFMLKSATIPGDSRVGVQVEAAEAGDEGNIEPQRLDFVALDESARQVVYAEAIENLTGGSGEVVSVVTEDDFTKAQEQAGTEARGLVEAEIRQELVEGWALLEESWTAEVNNFSTEGEVGDRLQNLPFTGTVQVRVLAHQVSAVEEKLKAALEERLSEEFILFPGPLSYTADIKDIDLAEQTATVSARVTHTTIPDLSLETLRSKVLGRSESEAREYLTGLPGVRAVSVELWPFWARSLPRIENRISIDLVPERQP